MCLEQTFKIFNFLYLAKLALKKSSFTSKSLSVEKILNYYSNVFSLAVGGEDIELLLECIHMDDYGGDVID